MARIPEHIIENVRDSSDIYDVVSEYVNLKKRGRNFFGLCPFHDEKTPSFSINIDKQIYKCFGCGKGGGTINFIMDVERLDFVDSIKFLGDKYNINVEIEEKSKAQQDIFNQIYAMNDLAMDYYKNNINNNIKQILKKRNIDENSINKFDIGLSSNNYDDLLKIIRNEKFSAESLKKSGLFLENERGYIDRFRNRIIFPIYNQFNKIVGFAGRIYTENNKTAKYMNSPETPVYNKSKTLYGMHLNKNAIFDQKSVIIVEGYLDLIQLQQAGFENVLAASGTAFTNDHAKIISKLCKTIYLSYDGDKAGIDAAIRAGYIILKNDIEPKVIKMPLGMDPDDWVQNEGPEPFRNAMENASSLVAFHYEIESNNFKTDRDKIEFINKVTLDIMDINNPLSIESLTKEIASLTGFSIDSILNTIEQNHKKKYKRIKTKPSDENKVETKQISKLEKELISCCFSEELENRKIIKNILNIEWLESEEIKKIYKHIVNYIENIKTVKPEIIMSELKDENIRNLMAQLLFDEIKPNKNIIIDCLYRLEKKAVQNKLEILKNKLKNNSFDDESETIIIEEITSLQIKKNKLKDKFTDV